MIDKIEQTLKAEFSKLRMFTQEGIEQDGSLTEIDAKTIKTFVILNYQGHTEKISDGEKRQEAIVKVLPNGVYRVILNEAEFLNGFDQGWMTKSIENTTDFNKVIAAIRSFVDVV